jgi:hypothetical protein
MHSKRQNEEIELGAPGHGDILDARYDFAVNHKAVSTSPIAPKRPEIQRNGLLLLMAKSSDQRLTQSCAAASRAVRLSTWSRVRRARWIITRTPLWPVVARSVIDSCPGTALCKYSSITLNGARISHIRLSGRHLGIWWWRFIHLLYTAFSRHDLLAKIKCFKSVILCSDFSF